MTTRPEMENLLDEVLALQNEDGRGAELTEERVREVLLRHDTFTAEEERLLRTSPLARLTYAEAAEDLQAGREAAFRERCARASVNTEIVSLAASGGGYPRFSNDDFIVELDHHPETDGWVVTLTLLDRVHQIVDPNEVLVLEDDQGATWLRGQVNSFGQIHSYEWSLDDDPAQRARRDGFKLRVRSG